MMADRTVLKRRTLLAMAVLALGLGLGLAGTARADVGPDLVDLKVVDRETGQTLQVWRYNGRLFVAGQPSGRYSLRITNHTGGRVLVVMSVDGVNVLTGQTAGYGQSGYVFRPYESYDVSGWRKSDTEVAAFTFTPQSNSYAARTGRPLDIGVIGIAAFRERAPAASPAVTPVGEARAAHSNSVVDEVVVTGQAAGPRAVPAPPPLPVPPVEHRIEEPKPPAASAASASAAVVAERKAEKLGTGHGAREWSVATTVPFERATAWPQLVQRIEYDSYENLVALGVVRPRGETGRIPRAFPNSGGYVPDPPGAR
jgi:hypothetical protein